MFLLESFLFSAILSSLPSFSGLPFTEHHPSKANYNGYKEEFFSDSLPSGYLNFEENNVQPRRNRLPVHRRQHKHGQARDGRCDDAGVVEWKCIISNLFGHADTFMSALPTSRISLCSVNVFFRSRCPRLLIQLLKLTCLLTRSVCSVAFHYRPPHHFQPYEHHHQYVMRNRHNRHHYAPYMHHRPNQYPPYGHYYWGSSSQTSSYSTWCKVLQSLAISAVHCCFQIPVCSNTSLYNRLVTRR